MMRLLKALEIIKSQALTSFFMPGHKNGRQLKKYLTLSYDIDITEIPGADYLHDPTGPILETEKALSTRYQTSHSKILVNGSTVGILSMIMGVVAPGEVLLLNRNAHKSVYHAIEMGNIEPRYFLPYTDALLEVPTAFSLDDFKAFIKENKQAKACLFTYPTYEGLCYDLEAMIRICHDDHMIVLVDEAHGAHLHLKEDWPKSALEMDADIVVQSFHKTLPALTQTAGLHINHDSRLSESQIERVLWYLKVLQTSSPSYLLMASVDAMLMLLDKEGVTLANELMASLNNFRNEVKKCKYIKCYTFKDSNQQHDNPKVPMDPTKLMIYGQISKNKLVDGNWIAEVLRSKYNIEVEYATKNLCLMMTSISTSPESMVKLIKALSEIDQVLIHSIENQECIQITDGNRASTEDRPWLKPEVVYTPSNAKKMNGKWVGLDESMGHIALEEVIPYPPGIPLIVPGERITREILMKIKKNEAICLGNLSKGIKVIGDEK